MKLPFLDRIAELNRLTACIDRKDDTFACVYGRRRCGKSRLLVELARGRPVVYYVGDERDAALQRHSLAAAMAILVPGMERVAYPDWEALLERWWREAPSGSILILDEFPSLVSVSPETPSLLQKWLDRPSGRALHTVVCGSSQRMMQGLVLDQREPLFGRAEEILEIRPLGVSWLAQALRMNDPRRVLEAWSVWGGIPRYWELALDHPGLKNALRTLVLDPMGVLHQEPTRLLLDDMREVTQAASILALIGQGCRKVSEMAGRMNKPATGISRPLQRLLQLGLIRRDLPFGASEKDSKRSLYAIDDPFLRFWFRFVDPNRSRLQAGQIEAVENEIKRSWDSFLGAVWEDLARASVPRLEIAGLRWKPAARWWGPGFDRKPMEVDILAESADGDVLLVGEVKLSLGPKSLASVVESLGDKIRRLPLAQGRKTIPCVWVVEPDPVLVNRPEIRMVSARDVIAAMK